MKNKTNIDNEQWLNKLKERVNSHVEPLPAMGWEELEKELTPQKRFVLIPRQFKNIAAAAALLVALFGVSLYFTHTPISDEIAKIDTASMDSMHDLSIVEEQLQINKSVKNDLADASASNMKSQKSKISSTASTRHLKSSRESETDVIDNICDESIAVRDSEVQAVANENVEAASSTGNKSEEVKSEKSDNVVRSRPSSKDKYHLPVTKSKKSNDKSWSVGAAVNGSGLFAQNESSANFSGYRVTNNINNSGIVEAGNSQTIFYKDGIAYVYNENDIVTTKHHQPITVGITARKLFKHGLSIESGINFTHLSSDITFAEKYPEHVKQKLNYIGIPLKLNWSFLNSRYFTLYVSAGGQVEKCIQGKIAGMEISSKPWQFSVLGGVGAQFNITKHVGIYAEPGVAYFFDNNSNLKTIRKEHPFNFNMQGGIRFTY